jgi:hypothetical protein
VDSKQFSGQAARKFSYKLTFKLLRTIFISVTFSDRSTHICAVKGKVEVAEVEIFCAVRPLNAASVSVCTHCLWSPHTPRYLFLNIVHIFCCYLLDVCKGFFPASSN